MVAPVPEVPLAVVVMGVSGVGKSTLGRALAERLGYHFIEGDDVHPPINVAKMAAGIPLNDDDRWPWLDQLASMIGKGEPVVVACSALRRVYRERLSDRSGTSVAFVHPELDRASLAARVDGRSGHFMPVTLLNSQLATLERPDPSKERAANIEAGLPLEEQVSRAVAALAAMNA